MRKKTLYRRKPEIRFLHRHIQGAIGKEYVIKQYTYGAGRTKYPDMSRIIASTRQRKCRNVFKEAVRYAKSVIANPALKAQWQKRLRKHNSVYNVAIKEYMLREKRKKLLDEQKTNWLLWKAFNTGTTDQVVTTYHNVGYRQPRRWFASG